MAPRSFADDILEALESFAKGIERFASEFLEGILRFLRNAAEWLERVATRIAQYLRRLFPALGQVGVALIKLFLLYLPGMAIGAYGLFAPSFGWLLLAFIYVGFMTLIGLSYRNR